jgi:spermidine/putrescine transport system ATP-binding protein
MQRELKDIQDNVGITFVYVTHDQAEALTMSDRIAVMRKGRLAQVGTPEEIYSAPSNLFVAEFVGEASFLPGEVIETGAVRLRGGEVVKVTTELSPGTEVTVALRPEMADIYAMLLGSPPPPRQQRSGRPCGRRHLPRGVDAV